MRDQMTADLAASLEVHRLLATDEAVHARLEELAGWCLAGLRAGGKVVFCGNGGSFADSQHLAAEFVSRLQFDRAPLASVALGTNSSSMSAIGNDYGYEQVFARELRAIGSRADVFIPISTSGNSPNVLAAVEVALDMGMRIMGWTGAGGGKLAGAVPCIRMPATRTERIQEGHILIGHVVCAMVESAYFAGRRP